jgi:hypothetical protein
MYELASSVEDPDALERNSHSAGAQAFTLGRVAPVYYVYNMFARAGTIREDYCTEHPNTWALHNVVAGTCKKEKSEFIPVEFSLAALNVCYNYLVGNVFKHNFRYVIWKVINVFLRA